MAAERRRALSDVAAAWEEQAKALTASMDARRRKVADAIAAADVGIDGLAIADGRVTLDGFPIDQASDAGRLRLSCAIAMRGDAKLKVLRVRDGSLLDADSLVLLQKMAEAADYQVWIEQVDTTGKLGHRDRGWEGEGMSDDSIGHCVRQRPTSLQANGEQILGSGAASTRLAPSQALIAIGRCAPAAKRDLVDRRFEARRKPTPRRRDACGESGVEGERMNNSEPRVRQLLAYVRDAGHEYGEDRRESSSDADRCIRGPRRSSTKLQRAGGRCPTESDNSACGWKDVGVKGSARHDEPNRRSSRGPRPRPSRFSRARPHRMSSSPRWTSTAAVARLLARSRPAVPAHLRRRLSSARRIRPCGDQHPEARGRHAPGASFRVR